MNNVIKLDDHLTREQIEARYERGYERLRKGQIGDINRWPFQRDKYEAPERDGA